MSFGQWKPTITLKFQSFPKQACIHKIINEPIDSNPQDDIYNLGEHPCPDLLWQRHLLPHSPDLLSARLSDAREGR